MLLCLMQEMATPKSNRKSTCSSSSSGSVKSNGSSSSNGNSGGERSCDGDLVNIKLETGKDGWIVPSDRDEAVAAAIAISNEEKFTETKESVEDEQRGGSDRYSSSPEDRYLPKMYNRSIFSFPKLCNKIPCCLCNFILCKHRHR
ncbi:unnamed protein product [Orchesella dallaii]|uniref:Uncharacterized protein n=1 Tax=Orchesella dallaii TaxID=48710 RepID=A0ABP1QU74_9HEXA